MFFLRKWPRTVNCVWNASVSYVTYNESSRRSLGSELGKPDAVMRWARHSARSGLFGAVSRGPTSRRAPSTSTLVASAERAAAKVDRLLSIDSPARQRRRHEPESSYHQRAQISRAVGEGSSHILRLLSHMGLVAAPSSWLFVGQGSRFQEPLADRSSPEIGSVALR